MRRGGRSLSCGQGLSVSVETAEAGARGCQAASVASRLPIGLSGQDPSLAEKGWA